MVAPNTDFAASKPDTDPKNRVGRFFSLATESVGADRCSTRSRTGEKRGYGYDIASVDTEFEYGPFGELIRATGAKKDVFNFRFSTKYEDAENGLLYYGYRYYSAATGRWLNRDPLGEIGELNLYGMVGNNPISRWDYLGMVGDDQIMRIQFVSSIIDSIHGASAFGYGEAAIAYLKTRGSWDSQGVELFRNWMNGFGDFTRFDDPSWSKYMKDNSILRIETRRFIVNKVISNSSDNEKVVDVDEQLSIPGIATGTGWLVGYDLLNGPNQTVGGYHIKGKITICGKKSEGSLRYTFNDLTDENGITDIIQSLGARIVTLGRARNFKTKISWKSDFEAQMNGNQLEGNGWPFSE